MSLERTWDDTRSVAGPNASYSVRIRVELDDAPGMLGRLATAIGDAGGNIAGLDIVEVRGHRMVRDITVFAVDEAHVARIRTVVEARYSTDSDKPTIMSPRLRPRFRRPTQYDRPALSGGRANTFA